MLSSVARLGRNVQGTLTRCYSEGGSHGRQSLPDQLDDVVVVWRIDHLAAIAATANQRQATEEPELMGDCASSQGAQDDDRVPRTANTFP
jgi:hypothetical protein